MNTELHLTVKDEGGDCASHWVDFCKRLSVKPLYIELLDRGGKTTGDHPYQMMCATSSPFMVRQLRWLAEREGFTIIRDKLEVDTLPKGMHPLYWEMHFSFDHRPSDYPHSWGLSRNLLNPQRKYWLTVRRPIVCDRKPCDHKFCFNPRVATEIASSVGSYKAVLEGAVRDTNQALDRGWL